MTQELGVGRLRRPCWRERPAAAIEPADPDGDVLVFSPDEDFGLGEALAASHGWHRSTLVRLGTASARHEPRRVRIDRRDPAQYASLIDAARGALTLYFLGGLAERHANPFDLEHLDDAQDVGASSLLRLVGALSRAPDRPAHLRLITNNTHDVLGGEADNPAAGVLLGLAAALPRGLPSLRLSRVDLARADLARAEGSEPDRRLLAALGAEQPGGELVAWRGGTRSVRSLEELTPQAAPAGQPPFKQRGVYLLTGGDRDIKRVLARRLASAYQARLVLVDPSPRTRDQELAHRDLEALGAELVDLRADCRDPAAARAALRQALSRFGSVDGLIHAPARPARDDLAHLEERAFAASLAESVRGAVVLLDALETEPLDLVAFATAALSFDARPTHPAAAAAAEFLGCFGRYLHGRMRRPVKIFHGEGRADESLALLWETLAGPELQIISAAAEPPATPSLTRAEPAPARPDRAPAHAPEPIAVVGMCGAFPGSPDLDLFWEHLAGGREFVTELPPERAALDERVAALRGSADGPRRGRSGYLGEVDSFDAPLCGISPREARLMDPQQRLFLQIVWGAIEDAGYRATALAGTRTGLFVGVASNDYLQAIVQSGVEIDGQAATGNAHSMLANRTSFFLDLHGPSEPINTGGSSALVAVHRAIRAIRDGECDLAIAGGVHVTLAPGPGARGDVERTADGYVRGEGGGAILLKPLRKAQEDGDFIHGVLLGSAVAHAGRAGAIPERRAAAISELLAQAYRSAGVSPASVSYLEAHGAGLEAGDPAEIDALITIFTAGRAPGTPLPCALGNVKANIGHLEPAAGIAGLIKVLLSMRHRALPPLGSADRPRAAPALPGSPFYIPDRLTPWESPIHDGRILPRPATCRSPAVNSCTRPRCLPAPHWWQGVVPGPPATMRT